MAGEMRFCPFCGKRLASNATFCVYCGKQLPVNHSKNENNTISEGSKSNGNRKFITIIMAIIALLFVGFGIKYTLGDSNSGAAKNTNTSSTTKNIAAAPATYSGWNTVNIGEVASLQYPPIMEVQSDKYRSITKHPGPAPNDIFIQQQGLNDMTPEGRSRYARILFKTHSDNDLKVSLYDKLVVTKTELDEFNKEAYNATTQQLSKLNIKILSWDPIQIKTINGIDCMYYHYTRQMNNNPVVNVYNYTFCNNRYTHVLTISYRESEKAYWTAPGKDIRNVVNTLKIKPL